MHIQSTDLVLEIGSGDNPHPRTDILCDRYLTTSHERAGGFPIRVDRPIVVADGMKLPFGDKTFDYVIASHIFEHMEDPVGFAREIMRVGKAGYIEVPSALSERVFGWNFHHWYCSLDKGVLTFTPKKEGERFNGFFHRFIAQNLWFRRFFEEHEDMWYVRLEWKGKLALRVNKSLMGQNETNAFDEKAWGLLAKARPETVNDVLFFVRFFFRRVVRKTKKIARAAFWALTNTMPRHCVCPACHGTLKGADQQFVCQACHADYPIDGVIPILLSPEERRAGY